MKRQREEIKPVELTIDGETYGLVYDFRAICAAERLMNRYQEVGENKVNLLTGMFLQDVDARQLQGLLYAALRPEHPKKTLDDVDGLIRMETIPEIMSALLVTYEAARPASK